MLSLIDSNFTPVKQIGPKSWQIKSKDEKDFKINFYMKPNDDVAYAYKLRKSLKQSNLLEFIDLVEHQDCFTILSEFCPNGDFNHQLIEFKYRTKIEHQSQVIDWTYQLLGAIDYLDKHDLIHTRISSYNIFVSGTQLKLSGFEFLVKVNRDKPVVKIDKDSRIGMFNAPELVKYGKINKKYHIWCLGLLIGEMTTCDWIHFRLVDEDFTDWYPAELPSTYSRLMNIYYHRLLRISPPSRPSVENLMTNLKYTKENSQVFVDELIEMSRDKKTGFGTSYLKQYMARYKPRPLADFPEQLTDSDVEITKPNEFDLEIAQDMEHKNTCYDSGKKNTSYILKEIIKGSFNELSVHILVVNRSKKRKQTLRQINLKRHDKVDQVMKEIQDIYHKLKSSHECIGLYYDYFVKENKVFCVSEYYEEGDLAQAIYQYKKYEKRFGEDKSFDYGYYICQAIHFLHTNNIVHRDIRPSNVQLRNDRIVLVDIGTEPFVERTLNLAPDQPAYVSHEAYKTKNFDMCNDIWGLHCIMYELMTLQCAYYIKDIKNEIKNPIEIDAGPKMKNMLRFIFNYYNRPQIVSKIVLQRFQETIKTEENLMRSLERD